MPSGLNHPRFHCPVCFYPASGRYYRKKMPLILSVIRLNVLLNRILCPRNDAVSHSPPSWKHALVSTDINDNAVFHMDRFQHDCGLYVCLCYIAPYFLLLINLRNRIPGSMGAIIIICHVISFKRGLHSHRYYQPHILSDSQHQISGDGLPHPHVVLPQYDHRIQDGTHKIPRVRQNQPIPLTPGVYFYFTK